MELNLELANGLAGVALQNLAIEYPNKLDHVFNGADDLRLPHELHPVFYASFDWHSCVHMVWSLSRLLRLYPELEQAAAIRAWCDSHLTAAKVGQECAYLQQASRQSFERTYGWAWLLKLQMELDTLAQQDADAGRWAQALQPLSQAFVERYLQFLPKAQFPIRAGTHANSAFGLLFALQYARRSQHPALLRAIEARAHAWFGRDRHYPARFEPGGDDFLSGGLMEAALMRELLDGCTFADWWQAFAPPQAELGHWLQPVPVTDRTDPKMAHLDGLNLSRAWCWRLLLPELGQELQAPVQAAIEAHLAASCQHALGGDYAGTHWLASFVLLALTETPVMSA